MANCFISYKREDEDRVAPLVRALRDAGLSVWWDREIGGGEPWRETIVAELDSAQCVLACWTKASIGPQGTFVREEAERAKARGVLLPVLLENVAPPFGFGEVQALNLIDWNGHSNDRRVRHVVQTARAIIDKRPLPKPPVGQVKRWITFASAFAGLAMVIGFVVDVASLQSMLCGSEAMRSSCRALGLPGVPSIAEESTWRSAIAKTDGDGFRTYLKEYPKGAYVNEAQARLAACRSEKSEHWKARAQPMPLFVPKTLAAAATESAARAATTPDVVAHAREACAGFSASDMHRVIASPVSESGWQCARNADGWQCRFDGQVICEIEERTTVAREVCS